ncbi:MAG TPA: formylglycine-generating enzyme family protein, partial [Gemmataceae bacterium]|nr:formylglycine-generating enzyme family protein [Gemmataceae bacterium]
RLSDQVIAVYVEATVQETETRLLKTLRKRCPALPGNLSLKETLAALRRGQGIPVGTKVLIVLDQFEQWLHANPLTPTLSPREREKGEGDLVQALRQCDGGRVQCVVMVRDDFWLAVSRFLRELEVRLVEGQNSALVDLFPLRHAEKVLAAFGRAFGVLPENPSETSKEQKDFLTQAVSGLAQEGKVISVRLALFAEMMKSKAWTVASLKAVGGTEGVGVTFLEETFSSATAPPEHRYHQKAARADLKILLPETGSDIKGHMRSYAELLEASGYGSRAKDFEDLIRILDNEIRLITPTDPEGVEGGGWSVEGEDKKDSLPSTLHPPPSTRLPPPATRYYQLTHDYLVHAIREWLTRKQKETRRGRAELMLADRAGVWNARPENRQLPALVQWLQIRWYTSRKNWTPPQQQMMRKAGRYHALRGAAAAMLLAVAALAGLTIQDRVEQQRKATHADGLVQSLLNAHITQVPAIVSEMAAYRQWTDPRLRGENDKAAVKSSQKLHTGLALLPVDPGQVNYLYDRLLDAEPPEVPVIRDALAPHKNELVDRLWGVVEKPEKGKQQQRLQAACALASYDAPANAAGSARWQHASKNIVNELLAAVQKNPSHYATLLDQLRPVRASLLPPLIEAYRTKEKAQAERSFATTILTDYAGHKPGVLADLLMDADAQQFAVVLATLREHGDKALALLMGEIDRKLPADVPSSDVKREMLAKRQANAAVALLRMEHLEKVWPLLKRTPPDDPRLRSYLIHRLSPLGADARGIIKRLEEESDITIRRALVLSLGEFSEQQLPAEVRRSLLPRLKEIYGTEHDPGLHAAVEWLLRRWKQGAWLKQRNDEWAKNESERLKASRAASAAGTPPQWYVNSQGQTMVVIPGPVGFLMGSPPTEEGRNASLESQHKRHIGRTYALASTAVTVRQFRPFLRDNQLERYWPWLDQENPDNPIVFVDWHRAAVYCNWLSQQEGIPEDQWCYETNAPKLSHEKVSALVSVLGPQDALAWAANAAYLSFMMDRVPQVTALKKGYLGLRGYRLPTEAEMEYACRAGAVTSRYYGETEELLAEYGWYLENTKDRGDWSVGVKKPNDLGLFDMHGNVFTWCQESFAWDYPVPESGGRMEDEEDKVLIVSKEIRIMRGGSRESHADRLRSAYRHNVGATDRVSEFGLRPARTLRLGSFPALPPTVEGGQE